MQHNPVTNSAKWINLAIAAVLLIACLIVYTPAMRAGFIWDDDMYITDNPLITAGNGLSRIWFSLDHPSQYFPMTYTVFYLEHKLWEFNPFGYHLVNILIHIANVFLVWIVLSKLRIGGAWLAAAIFALHPVNVESVAWITELKNVLMTFFYLLSIIFWLRFIECPQPNLKNWFGYLFSFILYVLALFSKTTACTLPIAMMIILWFKHIPIRKRHLRLIIPYIAFGVMMGLVTIWWEQVRGSSATVLKINYVERVLVAGKSLWFYIGKLILPVNLTFSYPLWNISWTKPLHYSGILAVICVAVLMWHYRAKIGRGPAAAAVFFIITLAPVLGFVSIYTHYYSYVADHYVYMACIGPIALFAAVISLIWHKAAEMKRNIISVCLAVALITFSVITWRQTHIYKDLETLWWDTLEKSPNSLLAHANIGPILENRGDIDQAIYHYRKALEIYPDDEVVHYNLGTILKSQGKFDEAINCFLKAIKIRPNYASAYNNLANTLKMQGKLDEAVESYQMAISYQPSDARSYYNLANTLRLQEKFDEAISLYQKAIELDPKFNDARNNLAVTLESKGRIKEAIEQYRGILASDSNSLSSLNALSSLLAESSDPNVRDANEAVKYANREAELTDYNNPVVLKTLVTAYAAAGRREEALETAQIAVDRAVASDNNEFADSIRQWMEEYKKSN
jgi:tetratricopeptide (TPR) repeat protein